MAATARTSDAQSNPFVKQLVSSNRTTRDRALASLRTFLARRAAFSASDLLKIWKALFYCMFMSDKPRNQQQLARDLAGLVDVCGSRENRLGCIRAFWTTLGREWGGLDSLRMDKFLYLVRCFVAKGFEVCKDGSPAWGDEELWEEYEEILSGDGGPLSPRDVKVPTGLRLHVVDVWLDELEKVDTEKNAPVEALMAPVRKLGKETLAKNVRSRVKECLEDERLKDWKSENAADPGLESSEQGSEQDFDGFDE